MNGPYKIGTLSRLTGFSPVLLRAWERRFALLVPERGDGGQRLYTDDDLAVLTRVRALVDEGRSIGEIARTGREALLASRTTRVASVSGADGIDGWRQRLIAAALAMDDEAIRITLDETFAALAADRIVSDVIEPVAIAIGDLWMAGQCSVASEHLVSGHFLHRLGRLLDAAQPQNADAPRVVAACFPEERHELGLMMLAWHVARRGVRVTYLGAALPVAELAKACQAVRPRATLLSVTQIPLFRRHQPEILKRFSNGSLGRVYVGGRGVPARTGGRGRGVRYLHAEPIPAILQRVMAGLGEAARPMQTGRRR